MERTYLYVPYEEYEQLKKLGANWDSQRKCWYLKFNQDHGQFERWLGETEIGEEEFVIESDKAFIACANTSCWKCGADIEVACIYCETGRVEGEPYRAFTVSNITAVDENLKQQLGRWPFFRRGFNEELDTEGFANHCPHCKALQGDFLLHCEPDGPFFSIQEGIKTGAFRLTPLKGVVKLNGDEGFEA